MATMPDSRRKLISSARVQGTEVYDAKGDHIGEIDSLIIDKASGQVVYAMMRFGGFLRLGSHFYPIPWAALSYDPASDGYRVELSEDEIGKAPHYEADGSIEALDDAWHRQLHKHYRTGGFWDGGGR